MKHQKWSWPTVIASLTSLMLACASDPGTRPEDMSAADHRNAAAEEDREAKDHKEQYNAKAVRRGAADASGDTFSFPMTSYNPTTRHLAEADKHHRHAYAHRDAAATLEKWEEEECGEFPPETRKVCPLIGGVAAVDDIPGGVRITFAPSVNIEAALAHVKCHRAFAAVHGFAGMDSCPMYVKKVELVTDSEKRTVEMTVSDPDLVDDLRARAEAHATP